MEDKRIITLRHGDKPRPDIAVEIVVLKIFPGIGQALATSALDAPYAVGQTRQVLSLVIVPGRNEHSLDSHLLFQRYSRGQTTCVNRHAAVHQQRHKPYIAA